MDDAFARLDGFMRLLAPAPRECCGVIRVSPRDLGVRINRQGEMPTFAMHAMMTVTDSANAFIWPSTIFFGLCSG
jgi:hypothetical protein